MKNIVTFETAHALKRAGFPQPEPEAGQVWWMDGAAIIVGAIHSLGLAVCLLPEIPHGGEMLFPPSALYKGCFAPGPADILRELPEGLVLHKMAGVFHCVVIVAIPVGAEIAEGLPYGSGSNPAEACALAWLELKKQNP